MSKSYKYKFSFVMPVYNVESYLAETVESIFAQSMDFEDNCEIIFINDGSTDESEDICLKYQKIYPKNIKYIKQKNMGVSAARNKGIEAIEGKYVSFLDPDDKLSSDTLVKVYQFIEANYKQIDFVSIKICFFEGRTDDHQLNYKFDTSRIIDITKEYDTPQLSAASAFFKSDIFHDKRNRFDTKLTVSEDVKLISMILLNKMKYGSVNGPTYFYRRRSAGGSAIDMSVYSKDWYTVVPKRVYEFLFNVTEKKLGYVPKYIQFLTMYDIGGRFKQQEQSVLNRKELSSYKTLLYSLTSRMDDQIIMEQRKLHNEYKFFLLTKKYKEDVIRHAVIRDNKFKYKDILLYDYKTKRTKAYLYKFIDSPNETIFHGYFTGFLFSGVTLNIILDGQLYEPEFIEERNIYFLGELVHTRNNFRITIPEKKSQGLLKIFTEVNNFKKFANVYILDESDEILKKRVFSFGAHSVRKYSDDTLSFEKSAFLYKIVKETRHVIARLLLRRKRELS